MERGALALVRAVSAAWSDLGRRRQDYDSAARSLQVEHLAARMTVRPNGRYRSTMAGSMLNHVTQSPPPGRTTSTPAPAPELRRLRLWVAALGMLALLTAGIAGAIWFLLPNSTLRASTALRDAYTACGSTSEISDGDKTLFLNMRGSEPGTGRLDVSDLACVLDRLGAPTFVTTHIDQTRAADGRQADSWGSFQASWTRHPDDGLDVLIRET
jgi:hypothetical protein